ncbi:DUF2339 domain-containing protein [Candidatus Poribacteria bacterium]|nr:DUF2339 domain-containing protein [Candidatus Poribacteria bacterium]
MANAKLEAVRLQSTRRNPDMFYGLFGTFSFLLVLAMMAAGLWLIIRVSDLARRVKELGKRVESLEGRGVPPAPAYHRPAARPEAATPGAMPPETGPQGFAPTPAKPTEPPSIPPTPPPPPRPAPGIALAGKMREANLEMLLAGNWLVRIGVTAILFGAGFFLKYAFDNQWIGETGRVMIGLIAGLTFLGLGEWYQKKAYRIFSQALTGGGIGLLYLSVYAAFGFYHLIPQTAAFALMILVTAASIALAVLHDALSIATLATLGGFLTPFLLSTGVDNEIGLFSYILLLDLGILGVAFFRNWRLLNYKSFLFTIITFIAWAERFYEPWKLWTTVLFLSLFFVVFAFLAILYNVIRRRKASAPELILAILNAAIYFGAMYALLVDKYEDYLGLFALVMGGAYVALAYLTNVRYQDDRYLIWFFLGIGATFVTLAIPIQLEQNWITIGWAVEGAILSYIGFRYDSRNTLLASLGILVLVFFRLLFFDIDLPRQFAPHQFARDEFMLFLNRRTLSYVIGIAAMLFTSYLLTKGREEILAGARALAGCLLIAANLLAIVLLCVEARDFLIHLYHTNRISPGVLRHAQGLSLSIIWAVYATFLIILGIARDYKPIRYMALLLFGVTILKVFLIDLSELERFYRIISFVALGLILIGVSLLYQKYKDVLIGPGT